MQNILGFWWLALGKIEFDQFDLPVFLLMAIWLAIICQLISHPERMR